MIISTRLFLFLIVFLGVLSLPAQRKPLPPRPGKSSPAVTAPSGPGSLLQFKEGNVSIRFPGNPKIEFSSISAPGALFPERTYSYHDGQQAYYYLQVISKPYYLVEDKETLQEYYDGWMEDFIGHPDYREPKISDVYMKDHIGRQVIGLRAQGRARHTARCFIIAGNVYLLQVIVMLDAPPSQMYRTEVASKNFFESFGLLEPRVAVTKSIDDVLPKDYRGSIQGDSYVNRAFGFSIKLPGDWSAIEEGRLNEMSGLLTDEKKSSKRVKVVLGLWKRSLAGNSNSVFMVLVEKLNVRDLTLGDVAKRSRELVQKGVSERKFVLEKDISEETINGAHMSTLEWSTEISGSPFRQKQYMLVKDNYFIVFMITAAAGAELAQGDAAMRTFTFLR
jgi:hypothetical protein